MAKPVILTKYQKMKKIITLLIIIITYNNLFSQNIEIKGNVSNDNYPISDVLIELKQENKVLKSITNEKGNFKAISIFNDTKPIFFSAFKDGFLKIKDSLIVFSNEINIILNKENITHLQEVVIVGNNKIVEKSNKSIYKINNKDYLKSTKVDMALKTIPNLSVTNQGVIIDNRKRAIIFIDGIEASLEDLNRLDVKEVSKIEVISNPSASYGDELPGGVIKIIKKESKENFYKGEIETYKGVRLNSFGILPSFSYKDKTITFKFFYSYGINNQNNHSELNRKYNNSIYNQITNREVNGWQDYLSNRLKINLSQKSNIVLSGNYFRYSFDGNTKGNINENNIYNNYESTDTENLKKITVNSVYNYIINDNNSLFIKFKYFNFYNKNTAIYLSNNNKVISTIGEGSAELVYEKTNLKFFRLPVEISTGYKNTFRNFDFETSNFNISQYINSLYFNTDVTLNDKISFFTSFFLDNTNNKNLTSNQNYNNFLPSISVLYKLNTNYNLKFDYSKKTTRPNANYLNPNPIFINPIYTLQGNPNLLPQIKNSYELSLSKKLKNNNSISAKLFDESYKNLITETFTDINNNIVNTYNNIGSANISGINLSFTSKLFKKIDLNMNNGLNYNYYKSNSTQTLVEQNQGFSFNSNLNLYAMIKEKISLNLNFNYNSHNYDLIQTTEFRPLLTFDIETNFFKEKLNVKLSYFDMFSLYDKTKNHINYSNFSQSIINTNKMTNLNLTLIYSFGKSFSDRFNNQIINNEDIKTK